ncbi:MAG TPA: iron-sulfur cluster assembly accessory protein [Dehalococcoidia bacterium]|nr:iron-sulfur cluster assembly accessory protein [Dehalococcoidia bacterium]
MVSSTTVVEFTDAAISKLLEVLKEQDAEGQYLRIAVATADHGGIEYVFGLEETPSDNDTIVEGVVKALVDDESAPMLEGSSIDYVEGFERSGFVISNPNFSSGCACGGGGCGGGGGGACGGGGGGACGGGGGACACGGH